MASRLHREQSGCWRCVIEQIALIMPDDVVRDTHKVAFAPSFSTSTPTLSPLLLIYRTPQYGLIVLSARGTWA